MTQIPIIMPQLGESIAEAKVIRFLAPEGADVEADQHVLEVETNKAIMTVTAPCQGKIVRYLARQDESYPVGAPLGWLEVSDAEAVKMGVADVAPEGAPHFSTSTENGYAEDSPRRKVKPTLHGLPVPAHAVGAGFMSPRMKARMQELGLHAADLSGIAGSGAGGRVTIGDFEKFLVNLEKNKLTPASSMRVAVADAMRRSWTRPLATVGLPVNLDALLAHRKASKPKPGPTLYALRALALALAENSTPAGRLVGNQIVHPPAIDIGFAVEVTDGVLVPVIRKADQNTLPSLCHRYDELVEMSRRGQLPLDAVGGSIATVTNFGTFGLTWATPIPLPEQTLVLGLGMGRKVPFWDESKGQFIPVTEANLTLSFDHRVMDGGAAGRLLCRLAQLLQTPEIL